VASDAQCSAAVGRDLLAGACRIEAVEFEAGAQDVCARFGLEAGRNGEPTALVSHSRTLLLCPKTGPRTGQDDAKHRLDSMLHMAVDTLGHLLTPHVTPAKVNDGAEVGNISDAVQ